MRTHGFVEELEAKKMPGAKRLRLQASKTIPSLIAVLLMQYTLDHDGLEVPT